MSYPPECEDCNESNNLRFRVRCKDMCEIELNGETIYEGYAVGSEFGMDDDSGGDYLIFTICSVCGRIMNGNFPVVSHLLPHVARGDTEWLKRKAAEGDNGIISVGGLVNELKDKK